MHIKLLWLVAVLGTPWWLASRTFIRALGAFALPRSGEWFLIAAIPVAGASAYWPYLHNGVVGSGDSYHYSLQVADAVTQVRQGTWPLLLGQSEYAFNGNVHTVRTAPYFTHLAVALDLASGHVLNFWQLTNLCILLTGAGAAWSAQMVVRWIVPDRPFLSVLLATPYVYSPAIAAPLFQHDMVATFMAVPFLPVAFGSSLKLINEPSKRIPWLLFAGSFGALWLAHPPTALTMGVPAIFAPGLALFREPRRIVLKHAALAIASFTTIGGYLFYSALSLKSTGEVLEHVEGAASIAGSLAKSWPEALRPLNLKENVGNVQLGYALWAILISSAGFACHRFRTSSSRFEAAAICALTAFLTPAPKFNVWLWSLVPGSVIDVMNAWPMWTTGAWVDLPAPRSITSKGKPTRWSMRAKPLIYPIAARRGIRSALKSIAIS